MEAELFAVSGIVVNHESGGGLRRICVWLRVWGIITGVSEIVVFSPSPPAPFGGTERERDDLECST